jgi:glycosyltransferase involved in cell wall biosynthesis
MTFDIVFWQNSLSIHQAPFLKALAEQAPEFGVSGVVLNVERGIGSDRKAQGWSEPDYGSVHINIGPQRSSINKFGAYDQHVFSGFDEVAFNRKALEVALKLNFRPFISLEAPRQDQPIIKRLRRLKYRYLAWRYRAADFAMLPKGTMGVEYYSNHGFGRNTMQEFAYFPHASSDQVDRARSSVERTKFIFVGQLSKRKNLGPILTLLSGIKDQNWSLDVVGQGPLAGDLINFVQKNGLRNRVTFLGGVENHEVLCRIAESDYLLLPSLYDGWGAVVNESLLMGTPALVSSAAGSSCLIQCPTLGYILDVGNCDQMREVLKSAIAQGPRSFSMRENIQQWALNAISPDVGAAYFLSIVKAHQSGESLSSVHVPWKSPLRSENGNFRE